MPPPANGKSDCGRVFPPRLGVIFDRKCDDSQLGDDAVLNSQSAKHSCSEYGMVTSTLEGFIWVVLRIPFASS